MDSYACGFLIIIPRSPRSLSIPISPNSSLCCSVPINFYK